MPTRGRSQHGGAGRCAWPRWVTYAPEIQLLVVCTANLIRSPTAAACFSRLLDESGSICTVVSAGTQARSGMPPTALATQAASELGFDITGHTSQPVSAEALERSDLVCCMTASHLRTCVGILPECWERTFTLGGLSTAASTSGMAPISGVGGCDEAPALADRLRRLHEGRSRRDLLGSRLPGDVVDPAGGTIEEHRAVASEIVRLVTTVVHLTWGRSELRDA